ncbi:MAG: hypothetical protein IJ752_07300 [Alphaproteobacteria bacterium]|nr:hypothetical protein [Alphaproteobacteria bacterium]
MYLSDREIAKKWGISERRVRLLCASGKIPGVLLSRRNWQIPSNAVKPANAR